MKDCDKLKTKAIVGISILFILYSTKYFLNSGTYSGLVKFLVIAFGFIVIGLTWYLVLPYVRCLSENSKKIK